MSWKAAAGGFIVILLCVPVIQGQHGWGVTFTPTQICAVKGSAVVMKCTYRYPSSVNGLGTTVEKTVWFTKGSINNPVDLTNDQDYSGRVQNSCNDNTCTLTITDLRKSDSAEYKFRFITNHKSGKYTGSPGVTLSVTDLKVHVEKSSPEAELKCLSSCNAADHPPYVWYLNGEKLNNDTSLLRVSGTDNGIYSCALQGYENYSSPPVYAPKLPSVSVTPSEIVENRTVVLTCSSDANPEANYTWYKQSGQKLPTVEPQLVFRPIQSSDSGDYYCEAENQLGRNASNYVSINVKYPPKLPFVSVSPSGEIVEGSSVNRTCSSDANPEANYTWYKGNGRNPLSKEAWLVFRSINSSDSGEYHCEAVNNLGTSKSNSVSIKVKYAPKLPSVSVSPSGEIVEGSSVTLTCSSDANPKANYTWYKENQTLPHGPEGSYPFHSISPEDRGNYHCKSENQYGHINSPSLFIDVHYAPKLPSVSVSPPGEYIVQGSSVTLTCSSDANPEANYTWYKENEDSPKASGPIFTITDIRSEHSGNYYCEAWNRRGRHNSTLHLNVVFGAWKLLAATTISILSLAIILISVILWIIIKRSSKQQSEPVVRPDNRELVQPTEQQDELHYATVHFSKSQEDPLYSNIRPALHGIQGDKGKEEEEAVEYSAVKCNSDTVALRTIGQNAVEDPAALYSTVNKQPKDDGERNL